MNVKTLKRFSRRSVSMLLSVLMVLSLFTVCMVSSSITAGAVNSMPSGATVEVELIGSTAQSWENVYIVIGVENDAGGGEYTAHYNTYAMSKKSGTTSTWTYTFSGGYGSLDWYFFTDVNVGSSNSSASQNDRSINAAYNSLSDVHKTSHQDGHGSTNSYKLSAKQYDSVSFKATDVINAKRNKSTKDWTNVYFVVGNGSSVKVCQMANHSLDNPLPTTGTGKEYEYTTTGGNYGSGTSIAFNNATSYFFTDTLPSGLSLGTNSGKNINTVYNAIAETNKTKQYTSKPASTSVTTLNVPTPDYITGVTLYNYRSGSKDAADGSGGQIGGSLSDTDTQKYTRDSGTDDSTGNETNYKPFMKYNQAVNSWFSTKGSGTDYTPLYAGNFRDTKATYGSENNTVKGAVDLMGLTHFVYLANVAAHDKAASTVRGLVSPTLSNGKLMQGNVEIPQFSDAFMTSNPTLQSKYTDVRFQVNKNEHESGNEWYSYDSSQDGNRYLEIASNGTKTLTKGNNRGGFFPFNDNSDTSFTKCFGMKMEVKFYMPEGGNINGEALQFNFTGDDDLWVFIDGYLILDMGGSHAAVSGSLNLDYEHNDGGAITATINNESWISNYSNLKTKANNYETNKGNLGSTFNGHDWASTKTTTFGSTTDAYKAITDTKKTHTMTIFYMERGLYDSNLKFEFMLPQTNTLTLKQEVDNSTVNQGLKQATMDVANKDVFVTQLSTQHMKATTTNIMHPPLGTGKDFTRLSPSQSVGETPTTLQVGVSGEAQIIKNRNTHDGYAGVTAAYSWTDESKLIAPITADNYGAYTETAAAKNSGVATPMHQSSLDGYVPLLYGQSAEFYDQFFTEAVNLTYDPNVLFTENEYIHRFNRNATVNNGTVSGDLVGYKYNNDVGLYDIDSTGRQKSTYYVNSYTIKDGYNQTVQGRNPSQDGVSGTEFPYYNADGTTNQVDITVTLNHVIRVGGISVTKGTDEGIDADSRFNDKSYKFKVEYIELFGDLDNKYSSGTWKTMDRVTYTLKEAGKDDQTLTTGYTEENNKGTFTLKKGQTAEIQGIPVGTVVRVSEVIEDDAEYEVKDITDGSGNKPTTTQKVENPMFITKGITNDVTYSYIIKNGLAIQTASLVVNNKVTTTDVNSGIADTLEKIVNDDVFGYKVQTNSKKVFTNSAKLPITSAFTRTTGDGTTSDTLQTANIGSGTKGNTGSTNKTLTGMDAYYTWTDTSGKATGSGVGVPVDNTYNVHLQYDQTATFDSQIALDKDSTEAGANPVKVNVEQAPKTYTNGANTGTGGTRLANIDNNRTVADLYTTTYNITGANSTNETAAYPKNASQLSENENVVIEYTFTNAVNLGKIQISKTVADGSDANINPNGSYEFTLTYHTLFGKSMGSDVPAAGWEGTISPSGNKIITDAQGKFSIKKDETITFSGVPVQTDYKVTEVIPTGAKYAVKGATLTDKDGTDISSGLSGGLTIDENDVCTVTNSLVNVADISKLTVDNTYSTVPVLYRYHNRVNVNGQVTSLQGAEEWTYFVKYLDGAVSTFINSGNITEAAKTAAISAFGTVAIDNVLATYSLTTDSTYTLKDLSTDELAGTIADDTAASVGYKASVQALNTNGNFYEGNKVILATIKNTARTYPVKVAYFKANEYNSTTKVNPMAEASTGKPDKADEYTADVPYNTVVPLNATITRLMLDDPNPTSNESIGKYLFAYWERQVTYQSVGSATETKWVPVSTNYQYSYKVVNPTTIRAVYRATKAEANGTYKRYYADKNSGLVEDGTFVPLDGGTTDVPTYNKVPIPHYSIYWEMAEGTTEKKYKNSSGGFTISASTATAALAAAVEQSSADPLIAAGLYYTVETEYKAEYVIDQNDTVSLPENGYDAAATDKVINPYVKQVGNTAQDRAVFDIVFGDVGAKDGDSQISNVGYILFYGNNYIDTSGSKVTDAKLKEIVASAADGTQNLTDASEYPGSGKCRVAKYTAITSGTPTSTNQVKITNKNRVDLIIDVVNDETSRKKFYTCYTYMIRKEDDVYKVYVSDTPITFSPSEITLGSGGVTPTVETAYNLEIDNYYQDNNNANPDDTIGANKYTKANTYGYALSNAYTFADGKNLTFTIRPLQQGIYRGKLVKLMAGSNEITPITSVEDGGQIIYTFNKDHIPEADGNTLKFKAYFDPTPVAAKFRLNAKTGIEYNVYFNGVKQDQYTVTTTGDQDVIVPFGTTVRVEAQTVLVNGKEGYAITDATKGNFDLADDSTRTKSQMAVKEVTVTDGMTSEQLQDAIGTQPTANELTYTVTVRRARGEFTIGFTYWTAASSSTNSTHNGFADFYYPEYSTSTMTVWQGNPEITFTNASNNGYIETTANSTIDYANSKITVTGDNAVITVGGYAPMTISSIPNNTKVYATIGDSPETEVDLFSNSMRVPYNYDTTIGTPVTIRVVANNDYLIRDNINSWAYYTKDSAMEAHQTVTLADDPDVLTDLSFVSDLPTAVAGYAVTIKAGAGGKVTITEGVTASNANLAGTSIPANAERTYEVTQGTSFSLSTTPTNPSFVFDKWVTNDANNDSTITPISFTANSTLTYKAEFVEAYDFTLIANPHSTLVVKDHNNATVATVNGGESGSITHKTVKSNDERTFTCTMSAENGYVPYWNNDPTDDDTTTHKTVVVSGNTSISTSADKLCTLTVNAGTGGSVTTTYTNSRYVTDNNDGTYTVRAGRSEFTLTAAPDTDNSYGFTNWTNGAGGTQLSTDNPYQFTLDGNKTITANFSQGINITLDVSKTLSGGNKWSYTGDGAHIYVFYAKASNYNDNGWIQMTETSTDLYSALVPNGYTKVIFVRTADDGGGWDNAKDQSPTGTNVYHTISETDTAWKVMDWKSVKKLVTKTVTLNANSSVNWTADNAAIKLKYNNGNQDVTIPMENTSGSIYSATITFPEGNEDITFQRVNPNNAGDVWGSAGANISSTVNWQVTGWRSVGAA